MDTSLYYSDLLERSAIDSPPCLSSSSSSDPPGRGGKKGEGRGKGGKGGGGGEGGERKQFAVDYLTTHPLESRINILPDGVTAQIRCRMKILSRLEYLYHFIYLYYCFLPEESELPFFPLTFLSLPFSNLFFSLSFFFSQREGALFTIQVSIRWAGSNSSVPIVSSVSLGPIKVFSFFLFPFLSLFYLFLPQVVSKTETQKKKRSKSLTVSNQSKVSDLFLYSLLFPSLLILPPPPSLSFSSRGPDKEKKIYLQRWQGSKKDNKTLSLE